MRQKLTLVSAVAALALLAAAPGLAQTVVQYSGTLQIGFGDSDNGPTQGNNGVPACAVTNPFVAQTFATLDVYGRANATAAGPGAALTFSGHGVGGGPQAGSGNGGSEVKVEATCNIQIPPFINPRLRSRTQVGKAKWPSVIGAFQGVGSTAVANTPTPATTPTFMVGVGLGNSFTGASAAATVPFYGGNGAVAITKGPNVYGGAVPYQGGGAVQLGINTTTMVGSLTLMTFGIVPYVNGLLPTEPQLFGTDAKGVGGPIPTTTFTLGVINGAPSTMAFRTPGGTTLDQQGFIATLLGGVTATTAMNGPALISPVLFHGAFFEWTTGRVQHSDMIGDFVSQRTVTGFDVAASGTTAPLGTTRRLQLVSPWSANISLVGPFGFPVPTLGFGGVAVLNLDIQPAPEPGSIAMIGLGIVGLAGLGVLRRRR